METAKRKYLSLEKLGLYDAKIKKVISDGDAATLASAKSYADGLATNYDKAGAAATVQGNLDAEVLRAKAAEEANAAAAKKAQDEVDALETLVGTLPEGKTSVVDYIVERTSGIATDAALAELTGKVTQAEKDIDAIEADYLKAQDKADVVTLVEAEATRAKGIEGGLETRLKAVEDDHLVAQDKADLNAEIAKKANQTDLEAVQGVANAAATQVALGEEIARASGVEAGLDARLVEVEAFFKLAEGEQLDTALDTLKEIQTYVTTEGAAADQMVLDIAANKKAIEDHVATDHDFAGADAALKAELEGKINAKADTTVVNGIDGRVTTVEGKVSANEQAISALQGAIGADGSVAEQIAAAVKVETDARVEAVAGVQGEVDAVEGRVDTLESEMDAVQGAVATKAEQEALTALTGRVTTVEGKVTTLEGEMDTVEGKVSTLEGEMDAVEAKALANENAISATNTEVAKKATIVALEAEIERAMAAEKANADAIALFEEISEGEINALFA